MTDPLLIDPSSSALLVMDYQIDVLEKFMAPADSTEVLSVLPKLLAAARSADMPVIYVVVSFRPGYPEVSPRHSIFSVIAQNGLLKADRRERKSTPLLLRSKLSRLLSSIVSELRRD